MFDKLGQARQMADDIKEKLETITVSGEAGGGKVTVTSNGNRKIKEVSIAEELLSAEHKEELQDLVVVAMNRALDAAGNVSESEMRGMMGSLLPGMGGLFGK